MDLEAPMVPEEEWTTALHIQRFVRPFTEKAAREMLSTYGLTIILFYDSDVFLGTVVDMWMPPIKTHCFVIYEKESEAHNAYLGTYNVVWPRGGKHLMPKFVSTDEAKKAIEDGRSKALFARASGSVGYQKARPTGVLKRTASEETPHRDPVRPAAKPAFSLEDLFFKTQAKPPIYYLPLTDEQVAEKKEKAKESKNTEQSQKDESEKPLHP